MGVEDDTLKMSKQHDFAPHPVYPLPHADDINRNEIANDSDAASDTTATNTSDEFDWDENEEAVEKNQTEVRARRGRAIYVAFMKLSRPIRALLIGVLGAGILITPLLVVHFRFRSSPARIHVHVWSLWLTIIWAAGCATYLVVDLLPRLIIALVVMFGGKVERLQIQVELAVAVSGWLKLALDISWAWISLSVIRRIYHPPGSYWTIVNRIISALFGAGIIFLVEKLALHFVAINFHQKALADRLTENQLALRALDRLSNSQPWAWNKKGPNVRKGHKSPASSVDLNTLAQESEKTRPKNFKGRNRRRKNKAMASVIVDQVSGVIGQVALKDSKFNRAGELGNLHSARKLAKKLFSALSDSYPPRQHLIVDDFFPYFHSTLEAQQAFDIFDKDGNGDISKKEMREAVQRIYKERKALVASLKDAGSAVSKLDAVFLAVALVCIIFICLLIFNKSDTLSSLVPLGTIILGFSFVFGNSASTLFESLIFIFATHVFDVGDLVLIDEQPLFVREFGLFSTTFRRVDGQEIVAPNKLLASSKLVHNLRRSNSMWETTTLIVSYNTPLETIEALRAKLKAYVNTNSRDWSGFDLNIDKMVNQNAIHLIVAMEHRPNWQDWGGRWARRTAFMRNLKTILEELDVGYTMPLQPVLLPNGPVPGGVTRSPPLGFSLAGAANARISTPG
ncbi:Mechanosensitive ion channel-domain-containing protein [Desarmillaria ectypa]|nr:Mechanosensitive ion channel-domain-containing protein [Desarmillaria ectypa]